MNKPKQFYEAPEAETLVVRFEGFICGSDPADVSGGSFGDPNAEVEDQSSEKWW